jgi:hypothetical protein
VPPSGEQCSIESGVNNLPKNLDCQTDTSMSAADGPFTEGSVEPLTRCMIYSYTRSSGNVSTTLTSVAHSRNAFKDPFCTIEKEPRGSTCCAVDHAHVIVAISWLALHSGVDSTTGTSPPTNRASAVAWPPRPPYSS